MNRRIFLTGLLPASTAFASDTDRINHELSNLISIHGNLIQNFTFVDAADLCGKLQCKRTLPDIKRRNQFNKYYGNCRDYNILLISEILDKTDAHIQSVYCFKDKTAHIICYHPQTQMVFDNWILLPKPWTDRSDLTNPKIWWDSKLEKWGESIYKDW